MWDKSLIKPLVADRLRSMSLRDICAADDMPDRATIQTWIATDAEFAAQCAHARVIQIEGVVDDMADIEERVLAGEIDPAAARVVLDSQRWRAMKLAPKVYGDKSELVVRRGQDDMSDGDLQVIAHGPGLTLVGRPE